MNSFFMAIDHFLGWIPDSVWLVLGVIALVILIRKAYRRKYEKELW